MSDTEDSKALKHRAVALLRANRFEEAAPLLKELCANDPQDPESWYMLSSAQGLLGNMDEAAKCGRRAIALRPDYGQAHVNLGNVALSQGKYDEAMQHYQQAIRSDPGLHNAYYNLGNLFLTRRMYPEAEENYRHVLRLNPDNAAAHNKLGNVFKELDRHEAAIEQYRHAIDLRPDFADAFNNLGIVLTNCGRLSEAADSLDRAVACRPDFFAAHLNLGNVLQQRGQHDRAIASYNAAIKISPHSAEAHNNLGNALKACGRRAEAEQSYLRAIEANPQYVQAHYNLGNLLSENGRHQEAAASLEQAVSLDPGFAEAWNSLGSVRMLEKRMDDAKEAFLNALKIRPDLVEAVYNYAYVNHALGFMDVAIEHYQRVIQIRPDFPDAHMNLGTALKDSGDFEGALEHYRHVVRLNPDCAPAYNFMGIALRQQGRLREAREMSNNALKIQPDLVDAHFNLANVCSAQGDMKGSLECFRRILELDPGHMEADSGALMAMQYLPNYSAQQLLREATSWSSRHAARGAREEVPETRLDPDRTLRVGYVSADFLQHPVGFFIEPVIAHHNAARCDVYCYYNNVVEDRMTARLKAAAAHWRDIAGKSDEEVVQQIRRDGIDILVDLSGHTAKHRLLVFAHRAAPIQATWMGYIASTGMEAMDYIIADRFVIPPHEEHLFVEKPARMPNSYLCFSPPDNSPPVSVLPAQARGYVTFGCLNNLVKVTPAVIACWSKLLAAMPDAHLFLKNRSLSDGDVRQRCRDAFARHGIEGERITLAGYGSRESMMAAYGNVDIALDPFPYTGGMTTFEALWMGVPVVSLRGDGFVSRVGDSIVTNAGLGELVADTTDGYIDKAIELAGDISRLADLRRQLRDQLLGSPLCDVKGFTNDLETLYRWMWSALCSRGGAREGR